jgi:TetR/AcrR family transcriptional repressor of mexJK operon
MKDDEQKQSERKHRAIVGAAASVFLKNGYDGTSMEEIAAKAGVSKQTVYKHFADKERLFTEIILATTDQVDHVVRLVSSALEDTRDVERDLGQLGREFISLLMDPQLLRLRRLVIAIADRMPELGRTWYEQGFERVLATLASCFRRLSEQQLLRLEDPLLAANHFVGLLLWIPVNQAMFTGNDHYRTKAALDHYADAAVRAFLGAYGVVSVAPKRSSRRRHRAPSSR